MKRLLRLNGNKLATFIIFLFISIGFLLRFVSFPDTIVYEWEQGRDAWVMKSMLVDGQFPFVGPRVAIEDFHLGPLYYYILSAFYVLTGLDPVASGYLAITVFLLTTISIYIVTNRIAGNLPAFISLGVYVCSSYMTLMDRVAWNVSFVVPLTYWTVYALYRIYQGSNRWVAGLGVFMGLFMHVHVTGVLLIPLILATCMVRKNRISYAHVYAGAGMLIICLLPLLIFDMVHGYPNMMALMAFLSDAGSPVTLHTVFIRLVDVFFISEAIVHIPAVAFASFTLMVLWWSTSLRSKDETAKYFGRMSLLLFVTLYVSTVLYDGTVFEYYYFIEIPFVLLAISWLVVQVLSSTSPVRTGAALFLLYWITVNIVSTVGFTYRPTLDERKQEALDAVREGRNIQYDEGSITSYLYDYYIRNGT